MFKVFQSSHRNPLFWEIFETRIARKLQGLKTSQYTRKNHVNILYLYHFIRKTINLVIFEQLMFLFFYFTKKISPKFGHEKKIKKR